MLPSLGEFLLAAAVRSSGHQEEPENTTQKGRTAGFGDGRHCRACNGQGVGCRRRKGDKGSRDRSVPQGGRKANPDHLARGRYLSQDLVGTRTQWDHVRAWLWATRGEEIDEKAPVSSAVVKKRRKCNSRPLSSEDYAYECSAAQPIQPAILSAFGSETSRRTSRFDSGSWPVAFLSPRQVGRSLSRPESSFCLAAREGRSCLADVVRSPFSRRQ